MPLPKHTVQPVRISQVSVPADVDNELEFVSNATLCNLMRQLASISQLATNMFEELTSELSNLAERTMRLQNRLVTLQADVQSMQAGDEDLTANTPPVQLAPFTSKKPADSRVLSRHTIPPSMRACYDRADAPPPLEQMDELRDDNRVSMKLFSDPDFFFDLWSQKMLQDPRHKGPRRKGGKTKTKGVANKNAISKPQIVIQQTGVGGNYVPGQTVPVLNTGSGLKPVTSPLVNNYVGKPVPQIAQQPQQQSMEHTLPPPPPPPTLSQSPVSPNYSSCQTSVISNGISSDKLVNNAGYPQTIAAHSVHQVNGHSSVPNCPPSQISYHPVHATNPPQHPPPPPLPSDVAFNNLDGHAIAQTKGYPSPPKDLNVPNSLEEVRFPLPAPSFFSAEQQHVGASSPGNSSISCRRKPYFLCGFLRISYSLPLLQFCASEFPCLRYHNTHVPEQ
ncbi:hypothetical protein X801_05806 [Opisthorchis viverrini]|uniref:Wiskott-Aldrich syndrome protein family member n=1 Tax=Opisthorchis viverrini TaxID=6198 RepID=A0A1S8WV80_OPIVI|nr:hypothetical protein X801_05806 [Opisthorchis viverrini]